MPKTRGRRPAPNPKKRTQRQVLPASAPVASLAGTREREPEASGRVSSTAVAPRSAGSFVTARRAAIPAVPRRRFIDSVADYAYVPDDLRRIGILSGTLFVLLVALSFVLPLLLH